MRGQIPLYSTFCGSGYGLWQMVSTNYTTFQKAINELVSEGLIKIQELDVGAGVGMSIGRKSVKVAVLTDRGKMEVGALIKTLSGNA